MTSQEDMNLGNVALIRQGTLSKFLSALSFGVDALLWLIAYPSVSRILLFPLGSLCKAPPLCNVQGHTLLVRPLIDPDESLTSAVYYSIVSFLSCACSVSGLYGVAALLTCPEA